MGVSRPIKMHIEELVVHGLGAVDGRRLGDALARELARGLEAAGIPPGLNAGGDRAFVDAGSVDTDATGDMAALAAQVASAIQTGLGPPP